MVGEPTGTVVACAGAVVGAAGTVGPGGGAVGVPTGAVVGTGVLAGASAAGLAPTRSGVTASALAVAAMAIVKRDRVIIGLQS